MELKLWLRGKAPGAPLGIIELVNEPAARGVLTARGVLFIPGDRLEDGTAPLLQHPVQVWLTEVAHLDLV